MTTHSRSGNIKKSASALKCSPDACPVIAAQGEGFVAERIEQVAREHGIPVLQDFALNQQVADIPPGEEIPLEVYFVIAGLLGYVFEIEEEMLASGNMRDV